MNLLDEQMIRKFRFPLKVIFILG